MQHETTWHPKLVAGMYELGHPTMYLVYRWREMPLLIGLGEGDNGVEVRWPLKLEVNEKTIGQPCFLQKPLLGQC